MKFIHTSDWHLGQNLLSRSRQSEHQQFLDWLLQQIEIQQVDLLIVAGDIFDCGNPPGYAQRMYYDFLARLMRTCCRYALITGGNHDSPAFLNASREILQQLNVHVFGKIEATRQQEVMLLEDKLGNPAMILCAVPFLRDRDVRKSVAGESFDQKSISLLNGIAEHYRSLHSEAMKLRLEHDKDLPIVATGHLFAQGGSASESVRDIYIGNLGAFNCNTVADKFAYLALGHLHMCQQVGALDHVRYSGSPIALSFSEADSIKKVIVAEMSDDLRLEELAIPVFQALKIVSGSLVEIEAAFNPALANHVPEAAWVEVQLTEEREIPGLTEMIHEWAKQCNAEVLAVKHLRSNRPGMSTAQTGQRQLSELKPTDVFERRLDIEVAMDDEQKQLMRNTFDELLELVAAGEEQL